MVVDHNSKCNGKIVNLTILKARFQTHSTIVQIPMGDRIITLHQSTKNCHLQKLYAKSESQKRLLDMTFSKALAFCVCVFHPWLHKRVFNNSWFDVISSTLFCHSLFLTYLVLQFRPQRAISVRGNPQYKHNAHTRLDYLYVKRSMAEENLLPRSKTWPRR